MTSFDFKRRWNFDTGNRLVTARDLSDSFAERVGALDVVNLEGLDRWALARGNALVRPVTITALGDSITWGVGSDDTNDSPATAAQEDIFRERAWCVQLRKRLNAMWGTPDAHGWMGHRSTFASGATVSGATVSGSIGPFPVNGGGGFTFNTGHTITYSAATSKLGKFTEIDVWYWGTDSGVSGGSEPLVTIDGVAKNSPSGSAVTGNLKKVTVTGLADTTHDVVISRTGGSVYSPGVTVRRGPAGFVLNRMAVSGSVSGDVMGTSTGAARTRNIDSALSGADLLIYALNVNDQGNQVPLATFEANVREVVGRQVAAGGCALLLGGPTDPTPADGIPEIEYRRAMRRVAESTSHTAYTDARDITGPGPTLNARGLSAAVGSVHPSAKGHGLIANSLVDLLTLPRYV